jgi:uncharacterized protein (TIGR02246 family)
MKRLTYVFALLLLLGMVPAAWAGAKEEAAAATQAWADAVNSKDVERILALYDAEAVLWGTASSTLRDSPAAIREYFKPGANRPHLKVVLGEQRARVYGDIAINTGYYTFSDIQDGQPVTIPARFSFTYRLRDGRWMIVDHHSSRVPPPPQ